MSQATEDDSEPAKVKRTRRLNAKKTYPRVKDIDFRPEGKVSLRDFWAQKEPSENNHEKNLVIVYYLKEFLEVSAIEVGHVLAGYDDVGVKSPAIPDNSLMVTASQKRWLDTSDMKAIQDDPWRSSTPFSTTCRSRRTRSRREARREAGPGAPPPGPARRTVAGVRRDRQQLPRGPMEGVGSWTPGGSARSSSRSLRATSTATTTGTRPRSLRASTRPASRSENAPRRTRTRPDSRSPAFS